MNSQKKPDQERDSNEVSLTKPEKWLDNKNVLERLSICARTLARWRKKEIIAFSRIQGKFYYRESDVDALFLKYRGNQSIL